MDQGGRMNISDAIRYFKFSDNKPSSLQAEKPKKKKDNASARSQFIREAEKIFKSEKMSNVFDAFKEFSDDLPPTPKAIDFLNREIDFEPGKIQDKHIHIMSRGYDLEFDDFDEFGYLFHEGVLKNKKYRKVLLKYLNSF